MALLSWSRRHLKALILTGLTVIAYLAAINRAQTLPWAMAALLTATLLTGILWPRWLVKGLSVSRQGPSRAQEGETIHFQVEVGNRGWLPRFMVELVDHLPFNNPPAPGRSGMAVLGVLAYVPGRGRRRFPLPLLCEKRGFYRLGPVGLSSSFPLGLAEARCRSNGGVQTLTVYPQLFPIVALPLRGSPSQIHRGGYLLPEGAGAAEFAGLREYRRGDNLRHVHWPTTARCNELMVKEFEPLASACLTFVLDLSAQANVGQGRESTLEYTIRIVASLARYATSQGLRTRLVAEGQRPLAVPAAYGEAHLQEMLDLLAVVDSDGATPYAALLDRLALDCPAGETVVVVLSGPPEQRRATLEALAPFKAKGAHLLALVLERDSFSRTGPSAAARDKTEESPTLAALQELGAHYLSVRQGDDLIRLFNS